MRILFMGTPDFAVNSFLTLCENFNVIGAVTQPDKPKGRGYIMMPPPVKVTALEKGIPVFQPDTLKDGSFEQTLATLDPEIIVVVAYGKILPKYILEYPKFGCINLHGSLLPEYRGAAPMQRAIIDGKSVTGVTTMLMAQGLDTGDMLETATLQINENDNFESIHDKLSEIGAKLLVSTIQKLEKGEIKPIPQNNECATYAAKIEKSDCLIDFNKSAKQVHDLIRGLSPIPLSYTYNGGKILKITASKILDTETTHNNVGEVLSLEGGMIHVACKEGTLALLGVVPEGKGRMKASDYINGRKIAVGDILGIK